MSTSLPSSLIPAPELSGGVLSQVQVFNLLMTLDQLLRTLPSSMPCPSSNQSCYAKLLLFHPLPSNWVEDIGIVGTVNWQLEVVFGTCAFGFKLKERGPVLESVIPVLCQYLFAYPGDVILQKWPHDLVHAASNAHTEANLSSSPKDDIMDLTGNASNNDELPNASTLLAQAFGKKRARSNTPSSEEAQNAEVTAPNIEPTE
ncbi:hypothetical protein FRC08_003560 [Ceratobasidium sp. 394]|nr:hypothetical protein FRC08_003560 [Ceratobasidium sp. 394]